MKSFLFSLLFFCIFSSIPAQAGTFRPWDSLQVTASELKLVGRGVQVKHSDQSIAIACENSECSRLRYVLFDGKRSAWFFGPVITRNSNDVTKALVLPEGTHRLDAGRGVGVMLGLTIGSIFFAPITVVPVAIFLGVDAIMTLSSNQTKAFEAADIIGKFRQKFVRKAKGGRAFFDRDGWSWTERPRRVSPKHYCESMATILQIPVGPGNCDIRVGPNSFVCGFETYVDTCTHLLETSFTSPF